MSIYETKARNKETGVVETVFCHDDHFGRHNYGYLINGRPGDYMREKEFNEKYEVLS